MANPTRVSSTWFPTKSVSTSITSSMFQSRLSRSVGLDLSHIKPSQSKPYTPNWTPWPRGNINLRERLTHLWPSDRSKHAPNRGVRQTKASTIQWNLKTPLPNYFGLRSTNKDSHALAGLASSVRKSKEPGKMRENDENSEANYPENVPHYKASYTCKTQLPNSLDSSGIAWPWE